ncbi:MAG: guanylate kinase [Thermodesulfovibrionales bacterium]
MKKHRGNLFIVSAPSGAGKTTLCQRLTSVVHNIRHSVSYTTRPPRRDEVNGRDYNFIDEDEFRKMIEAGDFVEWARVHGHLYGTSRDRLEEMRDEGIDVILDIDTQGAKQMRNNCKDGVYIFILPPSMDALRERLEKRMSNSTEEIDLRMKRAREEIGEYKSYDYVIVNNDFDEALMELKAIVMAERIKTDSLDPQWVKKTFNV